MPCWLLRSLGQQCRLAAAAAMVAASVIGCGLTSVDRGTSAGEPIGPSPHRVHGFIADVDRIAGRIRISKPEGGAALVSSVAADQPALSLLGGDAIDLAASNYSATGVGQGGAPPGMILVRFDIEIVNRLTSAALVGPTFPSPPPSGDTLVYLIPFEATATTTSGGTSGSGNEVVVELPDFGQVVPSLDFDGTGAAPLDGTPVNFFNDNTCPSLNDCFRYEAYAEIPPRASSGRRRIGYLVDPTVGSFRARFIVAADLVERPAAPAVGAISGMVSSVLFGPLTGHTVSFFAPGGINPIVSVLTDAAGRYEAQLLLPASVIVRLTSFDRRCSMLEASRTLPAGGATDLDFLVGCFPLGTLSGEVRFGPGSLTPGLSSNVVIHPETPGTEPRTVGVNLRNQFSSPDVQVGVGPTAGNGELQLLWLPLVCRPLIPRFPYTGLTIGGALVANLTIDCPMPTSFYQLEARLRRLAADTVHLTLTLDLTTRNDPEVNGLGPDSLYGLGGRLAYPASRLTIVDCPSQAFAPAPGGAGFLNFATFVNRGVTGRIGLGTCRFVDQRTPTPATLFVAQRFELYMTFDAYLAEFPTSPSVAMLDAGTFLRFVTDTMP